MKADKKMVDLLSGMSLEMKKSLYSFYLSQDNPTDAQIALGFALCIDNDIREFLNKRMRGGQLND